ncbi:MAG: ribosomal RNA small subunit methyltransferase A [Desulfobacterales bacterium]|nr:ribosomal RNA small subunit methyltransferase A [Desulfobacterales bacterium]
MISPKKLLDAHNIRAKKQLSQNFLKDPSTAEMIVSHSEISPEDIVLEIGAGLGALTIPLARRAKKVFAVEKDQQIIPILNQQLLENQLDNVVLLHTNILNIDIEAIALKKDRKIVVLGNLPYNISSQILVQLIKSRHVIRLAVLMFQKELAHRIAAQPGSKDYGRLSVMLQYCADIKAVAEVKASLFFPKPKVDSKILAIKFKSTLNNPATDEDFFFSVIKAAFGKRRKTLKNALSSSELSVNANTVLHVLAEVGIEPSRRAETLTVAEFTTLSNCLIRSIRF